MVEWHTNQVTTYTTYYEQLPYTSTRVLAHFYFLGAPLPKAISLAASVVDNKNILLIGGWDGIGDLNTVYKYNKSNLWEELYGLKLKEGRSSFPAFLVKETSLKDCPPREYYVTSKQDYILHLVV